MRGFVRLALCFGALVFVFGAGIAVNASDATPSVPAGGGAQAAALQTSRPYPEETLHVSLPSPCRIVDTRVKGGSIANNAGRSFQVRGTSGFAAQGGRSIGCGVPQAAGAVFVAVSLMNQSAGGYFRMWPYGTGEPSPSIMNFLANTPVTETTASALGQGAADLSVRPHGGATHVVIDVLGYDVPPITVHMQSGGGVLSATERILAASRTGLGTYSVTVDRRVDQCAVTGRAEIPSRIFNSETDDSVITVTMSYLSGFSQTTMTDANFHMVVTC